MNAVITSRYSAMRFYQWGPGESEHADYSTTKTIPSHQKQYPPAFLIQHEQSTLLTLKGVFVLILRVVRGRR